jgi:ParB/RepB/Spo0J family partition protein
MSYEIVCGERRWRAAKLAGLRQVPVLVRQLDDRQVVELQVVENLQRADLNAMEEAQGYDTLIRKHGVRPEDLAARIGKSRSHIYCRLKLMSLCPKGREALLAGKIQAEVGLLIARIPDEKLQEKALRDVSGGD